MAFMVHVITGSVGPLSDFLDLLPTRWKTCIQQSNTVENIDPGGPELHRIASNWWKDEMFSSMEIQPR